MIEATTVFKKCPDIRYRNVAGEGIVIRQAAGEVLVLNDTGIQILDMLADKSFGQLIESLSEQYAVDQVTLEQDIAAYLQELTEAGVIERTDSPATP